jgi:hypothetical protein
MRFFTFAFVPLLGLLGCREEIKNTCNASNPRNLPWMQQLIDQNRSDATGAEIIQYTYKGESVFLVNLCKGCADGLTTVYNCKGEEICEFGGIDGRDTCPDFSQATQGEVIWSRPVK